MCHINANFTHDELRDLFKFGQCVDTREVIAHFDHMGVLSPTRNTSNKIKVRRLKYVFDIVYFFFTGY